MPQLSQTALDPRKTPVQARSAATVDAVLEATIQVLLQGGKQRLTTTRVAARAGVSIGTLYQYFPNKNSLLQAVLRRHLAAVTEAVERVCRELQGAPLRQMATALIDAFLQAKMINPKIAIALYSVSSDVGGAAIVEQSRIRSDKAIAEMLATSSDPLSIDPQMVVAMLQGAIIGVTRRMLESGSVERHFESQRRELIVMACAYLDVCTAPASVAPEGISNRSSHRRQGSRAVPR